MLSGTRIDTVIVHITQIDFQNVPKITIHIYTAYVTHQKLRDLCLMKCSKFQMYGILTKSFGALL